MASRPGQSTRRIVVALDGPASSGKSSVGAAAAEQLQLRFVDTGLFYRALTALALLEGLDLDDPTALVPLVDRVSLGEDGSGRFTRVLLDGSDATEEARSPMVDRAVSIVARIPEVRAALLERQRELAADGGIVLAGRDIGTVVLPDADLKVFLDASVDERAQRRIEERGLDPGSPEAEEVREQLRARDAIDTSRDVAPLRAADDAVHVRTDGNAFDETVEIVAAEIAAVMMTPHPRSRTRSAPPPAVATATIEQAQPARPKRIRAPKAAVAESDGGGALAIAPAAELEQSPEDEPAAEPEAASEPDATPDQEAPSEPEPRGVPADDATAEAQLEPAGQRSGSTRRSQKRTRATLRRASETGVANEAAEKERIPEPELDPDSCAGPSSARPSS